MSLSLLENPNHVPNSPAPSAPRYALSLGGGLLLSLILFWLMQLLILIPTPGLRPQFETQVVEIEQPEEEEPDPGGSTPAIAPLQPPPPGPPSLSDLSVPVADAPALDVAMPNMDFTPKLGGGMSFGKAFGGFAGRGGAGTGTGSGFGSGKGFSGKPLVPLSTQRPQIPESAYRRGIEGWVQVVFTVTTEGRVADIKIVDAEPKGIFEAATVSGVSTWLYERSERPREVIQKIEFKLEDFKYNWN
ncbi:MAG: energy transducer TonB [Nevskiales bacterium]